VLGVPSVADRVAQTVAYLYLEPEVEPAFHPGIFSECPANTVVIGGGFQPSALTFETFSSLKFENGSEKGWEYQGKNNSIERRNVSVFAYCLSA
jgi:hypothetical protein